MHHVHMDSVFAGRMVFEAGLRGLTRRGPPSLQMQCVYESAPEYLKTSRRSIKLGGGGQHPPPLWGWAAQAKIYGEWFSPNEGV